MKKTGELLKAEREKRHISLNEISLTLKISTKILKAIEDGDSNNLPAKTFLRGFVQSYATALKLNTDDVLAVFYEEMGTTRPAPRLLNENGEEITPDPNAPAPSSQTVQRIEVQNTRALGQDVVAPMTEWSTKQKIAVFGGTLVLLFGIFITRKIIEKYEREADVATQVEVPAPLPQIESGGESIPGAEGTADTTPPNDDSPISEAAPATPATPVSTPSSQSSSTQKIEAQATTAPTVNIKPVPTEVASPAKPEVAVKPDATAKPEVAIKPSAPTEAPEAAKKPETEKKLTEVIVEALDNVSVEFVNADGKKESLSLKADQVHTFKSKGLSLNISDGGAVNIIVNGKDKGVPGNLGKPIKLSY